VQIRFLLLTGPSAEPAEVSFGPGLNVIYGGSNTGKTHILRLLNFALGSSTVPEPVSEQADYDMAHLGITFGEGQDYTIVRALQGGDAKLLKGLTRNKPRAEDGENLSVRHGAKKSLSKFLLRMIGAEGARIRVNAKGLTRDLSFRDLSRHVLINETKIQSVESPIQFGQYMDRTAEMSTFKYLVSGVDDAALAVTKTATDVVTRTAAQLELIDRLVSELDREIDELDADPDELQSQEQAIDQQLNQQFSVQENTEATYRTLSDRQRSLRDSRDRYVDRMDDVRTLLARFSLLSEHYASDIKRLEAIREAGQLIDLEPNSRCPLCGADPEHRQAQFVCEGDASAITAAAGAQIEKTTRRAKDLRLTKAALEEELLEIQESIPELDEQSKDINIQILHEVPAVQQVRAITSRLVQLKLTLSSNLDLIRRRARLKRERDALGVDSSQDSTTVIAQQQLDGSIMDSFCQEVEKELQSWDFPTAQRVFFDLTRRDITIGGKPRAANGKGVRSLLHAAFSIALMKFSSARQHSHPGFLVLDSLFITYRDPEGEEDAAISGTPLKDRAFKAFAELGQDLQLIVLENVDVPSWLEASPQCLHFTGNPSTGRAGLFPPRE